MLTIDYHTKLAVAEEIAACHGPAEISRLLETIPEDLAELVRRAMARPNFRRAPSHERGRHANTWIR